MSEFGIHSERVLVGSELISATVIVDQGKIKDIQLGEPTHNHCPIEYLGKLVVMPGLIDSHVHINEPGRTDWEGFDTATKSAAAGGITTLVDMPLNSSPVTTTKAAFESKLEATEGKLHVNCGFYGGIVPGNTNHLDDLITSGVLGVKAFLTHSGIDEFPNVTEDDLRKGLPILKKHHIPLLVHAELSEPHHQEYLLEDNPTSYQAYLKSRPKVWEDNAIDLMIKLCEEFDTPVHIVHLCSSNSITTIQQAKSKGLPITTETCPHYLYFNAEDIPDGQTAYKCAPPIREKENNDLLWQALRDGLFSVIVTDHSPAIPEIKELNSGNLKKAWGGIAGLQFSLPVLWTKAKIRGISIPEVAKLMSSNVADFLNLSDRKGRINAGFDADLLVWDPEETFEVKPENIHYKHKISPYIGERLSGVIKQTYVGGNKVFDQGKFIELNQGKIIKRA